MNGWVHSHLCSRFSIIHYNGAEIEKEHWRVKSTNHGESSCALLGPKFPSRSFTQLDLNVASIATHNFFLFFLGSTHSEKKESNSELGFEQTSRYSQEAECSSLNNHSNRLGRIHCPHTEFRGEFFLNSHWST